MALAKQPIRSLESRSPAALSSLVVDGLSKRYGEKQAVRDVSLEVAGGTIHGLVGPNGSGKSTILRSVLGLVRPDAGTIRVLGGDRRVAAARPHGGLAGLVDDPRFYPYLSARANLRLLARLDGGERPDIEPLLAQSGLAEAASEKVGGFSLGMRQRLGLVATLMRRPAVMLLDEPANGLDPTGAEELWRVVRRLAGEGTAVLLSSHDLVTIDEVCDAITVLRAGEVAWSGPIAELRALAPPPEHLLRTAADEDAADLAAALDIPARAAGDGVRVLAGTEGLERLTVALGGAGIGIHSLVPGESPLRVLFTRLTEGEAIAAPRPESVAAKDPAPERIAEERPRLRVADVFAACAVEARKVAAQVKVRALLLACLAGPWLFELAVKSSDSRPSDTLFGQWILQAGAALPLVVLTFTASWAFALLASLVAGDIFSSEDRLGTWPTLLTRSRPQSAIVLGKVVVAVACTLAFVTALAVSAGVAGLVLSDGGPLPGLTGELLSSGHAFALAAAAWAAALPVALAWTLFALALSAGTRNSVIGIAVPAVTGIVLQVVWLIDGPPLVRELVPIAALDSWHGLFEAPAHTGPLLASILVAVAWAALALIVLAALTRRRDAVAA